MSNDLKSMEKKAEPRKSGLSTNFLDMPIYRSAERIPEVLSLVEKAWRTYTDLRFGQLILNIVREERLFSIEDDELVELLKTYIEAYEEKENTK